MKNNEQPILKRIDAALTRTITSTVKKFADLSDKGISGILGNGTLKDLKDTKTFKFWTNDFWQKDNLKGFVKGLFMSAVTLAPAIAFGVATGGVGFIAAPFISYGISKTVRGTASLCGFKGFDKNADDRKKAKLDSISPKALQEKKAELKEQSKDKTIFAACGIGLGVLVTALTGGAALPLLVAGCLVGGATIYSASNDKKNAKLLEGITDTSSKEQCGLAAVKLGMIKENELQKIGVNLKESTVNEKSVNKVEVKNEGAKLINEKDKPRTVNMNDNWNKSEDKNQVKQQGKIVDMNLNPSSADKAKKIIRNIKNTKIDKEQTKTQTKVNKPQKGIA